MRASDLEIDDLWFGVQLLVKQACSIFNKLGKRTIHFSKGLLVLTFNHDLCLRLKSLKTGA